MIDLDLFDLIYHMPTVQYSYFDGYRESRLAVLND